MQPFKYLPVVAVSLLAIAGGAPAIAQTQNLPWVQMETMSVNAGIGGQSGDGLLHLPNLATNCSYPFTVSGFVAGIHVGISKVSASGPVAHMTRVSHLSGDYGTPARERPLLAWSVGNTMN